MSVSPFYLSKSVSYPHILQALSQMEHFMCICGLTDLQWPPRARVVKSTRPWNVPFLILAFRRVLASAPLWPLCALDPHFCPHWGELLSRLLPDSQSGITSRKCGLRGRPRGFRVPFGTGPYTQKYKGIHGNPSK